MKEEKQILFNSPEAATKMTVTGWVSAKGHFYGKDEQMARYDGCTHKKCECGNLMEKGWSKCQECRRKASEVKYSSLEFKEWDGKTPLTLWDADDCFWDADDINDYLFDNVLEPADLKLVLCRPEYLSEINTDQWEESLPEDGDGELPKELNEKIKELNKFIDTMKPVGWFSTNIRTEYKADVKG